MTSARGGPHRSAGTWGRATPGRASLCADREQGSGTVLTVAMVAVALMLAAILGVLVRVQVARNGAQTAADLSALAAAGSIAAPPGVVLVTVDSGSAGVCGLAGDVAVRNGSTLARCTLLPEGVVQVTTTRSAGVGLASATARAGPPTARTP